MTMSRNAAGNAIRHPNLLYHRTSSTTHHGHYRHAASYRRSTKSVTSSSSFSIGRAAASGSGNNGIGSYQTNGGTIEGVWVFHRHGDRSPCRPLTADHMIETEAEFWRTKIPPNRTAYRSLSRCYPSQIHPSNNHGAFLDVKREPFGFLTYKGMEQMRTAGRRFAARYRQYGHRTRGGVRHVEDEDGTYDFLDDWDVAAYSTNYLRTVMSAQCFLDGLMGTDCARSHLSPHNDHSTSHAAPPSTSSSSSSCHDDRKDGNREGEPRAALQKPLIPVQVRDRSRDTLNAFDRNPDHMMNLVSEVVSTPAFAERDAAAAPLAARLANFLPGLTRAGQKLFGGPSGINWIHASDHFVCRASHGVPFAKFGDRDRDDRVEQTLSAMAHPTVAHLAWRFRMWYSSPALLAAIAAPPLREVATQIASAPSLGVEERRPFVIYSCHDVTILSLLYGIGADFLQNDEGGEWRFWPAYASTLVFELVRVKSGSEPDSHVVRILLNGRPVRVVSLLRKQQQQQEEEMNDTVGKVGVNGLSAGGSVSSMLSVSDFINIVTDLERAGGLDLGQIRSADPDVERDMAGWTG